MSDFLNDGWSIFIAVATIVSLLACLALLAFASRRQPMASDNSTGHVFDGDLVEMNNPLPMWWVVLFVLTVVFSFVYYLLADKDPEQFVGLVTRLDALYFATTTTATVGFGDVHAEGQFARGVVTAHMVFNIVFIAAVVNLAKERMTERRAALHHDRAERSNGDG